MKNYLLIYFLFACSNLFAQSNIDQILNEIKSNNKTIEAARKFTETQYLLNKTDITLPDPFAEMEYFKGSNTGAADETEIKLVQSFDFPTVYFKRKNIAQLKNIKSDYYLEEKKREILLEAKLVCLEIIYYNKLLKETDIRKSNTEKWVNNFETALNKGEGNILDLNKSKLQLVEIKSELRNAETRIKQLNEQLVALNGNKEIIFRDTIYPATAPIESFNDLLDRVSENDPVKKSLEQEVKLSGKQIELQKQLWLPDFSAGYLYRTLPNENFNGMHFGLSIPLWENKYNVKAAKANKNYAEENLQQYIVENNFKLKEEYENYLNLSATLEDYRKIFNEVNNQQLLDKALEYGEITVFEYFIETTIYYQALQNFLKTENEFHQSYARLYRYMLIN